MMLDYNKQGKISLEKIAEKMSHAVAECFRIKDRGYIRAGYFADLVVVDLNQATTVKKENLLYKCGWSPLEGVTFPAAILQTFVNGNCVYNNSVYGNTAWDESIKGQRMLFEANR
jgi:dihydroorotase